MERLNSKTKPGEILEVAIWTDGSETEDQKRQHKVFTEICMQRACEESGVVIGPITYVEKRPGEEHVPSVPDNIQGERVRLLVAEAPVVGWAPESSTGSFIANLDKKDLVRLRYLTRRAARAEAGLQLTDEECDEVIEEIGPEAALETLKDAVDKRVVH